MPLDSIRAITTFATDNLTPDLTLLLDIDPERGLRRRQSNNEEWNRLDDYELAFHRRVRDGFFELVKAAPARLRVINADKNVEELQKEIREIVMGVLR